MSVAYWFPEWSVLCVRGDETHYSVINGAWDFRYDPTTGLRYLPSHRKPIDDTRCYPVKVTKGSFRKMGKDPEAYYW